MATATLRTGDVKRLVNDWGIERNSFNWAVVVETNRELRFDPFKTREAARNDKRHEYGERIAKILKVTPKTVTVEITK